MSWQVERGDCVEVLERLAPESIDAVVTDPPYGLAFMGAAWDTYTAHRFQEETQRWAEACLRVLKPGGHLLAFGGTRTYHRLVVGIEDAGFEIRDRTLTLNGHTLGAEVDWLYGSGWPKSRNIGKAIDKRAGAEREVVGSRVGQPGYSLVDGPANAVYGQGIGGSGDPEAECAITAPATPEAEQWEGWGTALKPAHEPIVVARKPFRCTVEEQVLATGTGALNIDACRIDMGGEQVSVGRSDPANRRGVVGNTLQAPSDVERNAAAQQASVERTNRLGRWPANVVLLHAPECERVGTRRVPTGVTVRRNLDPTQPEPSIFAKRNHPSRKDFTHGDGDGMETIEAWECAPHCPIAQLDGQSGELRSGDPTAVGDPALRARQNAYVGESRAAGTPIVGYGDQGGASRFFYSGKASPAEREAGLEALDVGGDTKRYGTMQEPQLDRAAPRENWTPRLVRNVHPTVKPIDLMRWLVRLVTPPGGTVLDPFTGSGSTGCAAALEGVNFLGVELSEDFHTIAEHRIRFWASYPAGTATEAILDEVTRDKRTQADADQQRADRAAAGQDALFNLEG